MDTEKNEKSIDSLDSAPETGENQIKSESDAAAPSSPTDEDEYEYVFVDNDDAEVEEDLGEIYKPASMKLAFDPKTFISIGGAFIGMIVSVIPSLLCNIIFKTLTPILYLPIPLIIYAFIGLLRGYKTRKTTAYVIIFSIIGTYLAGTLYASSLYAAQYNMPLYEIFRVAYYLAPLPAYVYSYMSSGILYGIVFLAFGIYFTIELGLRYEKYGKNAPPIFFKKKAKKDSDDGAAEAKDEESETECADKTDDSGSADEADSGEDSRE